MLRHRKWTEFGEGVAQYYMDGQTPSWTLSAQPINATTGHAVYYTLQQLYKAKKEDTFYLMFNDWQPSGKLSVNHGHAKGTLGFDKRSGFWLIHSVPRFPRAHSEGSYQWAHNGCVFGQMLFCVSFAYKSLGILAKQLLFYYPYVYDSNLPGAIGRDFPKLGLLMNNTRMRRPPYSSVRADLVSLAGMPLTSFAKFTYFEADLYDALIAPTLKTALVVESWLNSQFPSPNNCSSPYRVYNGYAVTLPGHKVYFKDIEDHSKYAVSFPPNNWVCIGGMNRITKEYKRGGGALCFQNQQVWNTYWKTVTLFHACPNGV
ncbi:hypothetical protein V1264_006822 [Littorina saxatilis]